MHHNCEGYQNVQKNMNKTVATKATVESYIASIVPEEKQNDAIKLLDIIGEITRAKPVMWGTSIVGFGEYHYKYDSGREGDMCRSGFSARKTALTIYCLSGFEKQSNLLKKLGKHKLGKSCLYIKKISDVDIDILRDIIRKDWDHMAIKHPQDT